MGFEIDVSKPISSHGKMSVKFSVDDRNFESSDFSEIHINLFGSGRMIREAKRRRDNFQIDPQNYISSIPLPPGWFAYKSGSGRILYYNCKTKKSQWNFPSAK